MAIGKVYLSCGHEDDRGKTCGWELHYRDLENNLISGQYCTDCFVNRIFLYPTDCWTNYEEAKADVYGQT